MKFTRTTFFVGCLVGGMSASLLPLILDGYISPAHSQTQILPFQGRLTDASGIAVPDGSKVVEFRLYDAPTGGAVKWAGEVQKLSINGGLVSTMLGSKTTLGGVNFATPSFLQITIDANGDGQITAADPPLLPRQSVAPAVYAAVAGQIQYVVPASGPNPATITSRGWEAVFDNGNPDTGRISGAKLADSSVPGGKVVTGSIPADAITANNQIGAAHLAADSVDTAELNDHSVTSAKIADGAILEQHLSSSIRRPLVPTGTIISYAGATGEDTGEVIEPIPGYLLCNGAIIDSSLHGTKYDNLRAAIGKAWGDGGNPANPQVANLPDLRGVFLRGWMGASSTNEATNPWADPDATSRISRLGGGNTGNNVGSFQQDQFQSHTHPYVDRYRGTESSDDANDRTVGSDDLTSSNRTTSATGGSETRSKNANVAYLIKY